MECDTAEAVPAVRRLLCHPVSQYYSPIFIHPLHQTPAILRPPRPARQVLQAPDGPTCEIISFSGTGGAIATSHLVDGLPDPIKPADSQPHNRIDKRLMRQLKTYGLEDPPVRREKSIPLGIVHSIVAAAASSSDPRAHHISYQVTIGL